MNKIKKLNKGILRKYAGLLAFLLLLLGTITSCKKDDNNNEPVAEYGVPSAKFVMIE